MVVSEVVDLDNKQLANGHVKQRVESASDRGYKSRKMHIGSTKKKHVTGTSSTRTTRVMVERQSERESERANERERERENEDQ